MQSIQGVSNSEQLYWLQTCFALIVTYKYVSETGKKIIILISIFFHTMNIT